MKLPGDRYTVSIEAAGHVAQSLAIEVADRDQAIFNVDLKPVGQ